MISSLSDQRSFDRLRQHGCRVRVSGINASWAPPVTEGASPRLAFAIPRSVGSAVIRNRARRRVRARVNALETAGQWPDGDVLLRLDRSLVSLPSSALDELVAEIPKLVRERCVGKRFGVTPPVLSES